MNDFAESVSADLGGVPGMVWVSGNPRYGCGGTMAGVEIADSKKEKSASAQESMLDSSSPGGGGVEGLTGSAGSVLEAKAENFKSFSSVLSIGIGPGEVVVCKGSSSPW